MAFFIISDIHGSAEDLQIVLDKFRQGSYEGLFILGDLLSHGPRNPLPVGYGPLDCISQLEAVLPDVIAVTGNCDAHVDVSNLPFPLPESNIIPWQGRKLFLHHGHLYSTHPRLLPGDVFLSGHTHIPTAMKKDGIFYCNPGSISLPKGGYAKSYAILNEAFTVYNFNDEELMRIEL